MRHSILKCALLTSVLITVGACGGGGGGTSQPAPPTISPPPPPLPPSPPPPANNAPNLVYEIPSDQFFSGEEFYINARKSSDPENDSLAYEFAQIAGPAATNDPLVRVGVSEWVLPEVNVDNVEELVFEVRVSDNQGATSSEQFSIFVRGFSGPGLPVGIYDPPLKLAVGNVGVPGTPNRGLVEVIATRPVDQNGASNLQNIVFAGATGESGFFDYSNIQNVSIEDTFAGVDFVGYGTLSFNLALELDFEAEFSVLDAGSNILHWFTASRNDDPIVFRETDTISIDSPCYVTGRTNTGQDFIWIGQKDRGLSVVRLEAAIPGESKTFEDSLIHHFSDDRSFCHILPTQLPDRLVPPDFQDPITFSSLIALDFDTNELVLLGDADNNQAYEEVDIIPLATQTSEKLEIVDVFSFGSPSLVPRSMVILLTNEIHDGEHRLIVVSQDNETLEIDQVVYSWDEGVPVALLEGSFVGIRTNDQTRRDIVVVTSTSSNSLYFENTVPEGAGVATVRTYAQPEPFEVGVGAGSAVTARSEDFSGDVVMVSFPETGEVRVFKPSDG